VVGSGTVVGFVEERGLEGKGATGDKGQYQLSEVSELPIEDSHQLRMPRQDLYQLLLRDRDRQTRKGEISRRKEREREGEATWVTVGMERTPLREECFRTTLAIGLRDRGESQRA
jgi:hypothetical protein